MTIIGTDISHWEDDPDTPKRVDFDKMENAGAHFCIFKATQGRFVTDLVFTKDYDRCPLIKGAYHYLDWKDDADKQAAHFCEVIAGHKLDFPPIVDFECRTNPPDKTTATKELWAFITIVKNKTGRAPMIYTGPSYWVEYGSPGSGWAGYPLWIAHYTKLPNPTIPAPWSGCYLWQYTDKGDGPKYGVEAKSVDLNRFDGTIGQLKGWLGIDEPEPVQPTNDQMLQKLWDAHPELH